MPRGRGPAARPAGRCSDRRWGLYSRASGFSSGLCDDQQLLALAAHELAHIRYGDPGDPERFPASEGFDLCWRVGALVAGCIWSTVVFAGAWLLGVGLDEALSPAVLVFIVAELLILLGLIIIGDRRSGVERRCCEIRADLVAAQVAGKPAVLSFLRTLQPPRWSRRLEAWVMSTHPPARVRISALSAYACVSDPDAAARSYWERRRQFRR